MQSTDLDNRRSCLGVGYPLILRQRGQTRAHVVSSGVIKLASNVAKIFCRKLAAGSPPWPNDSSKSAQSTRAFSPTLPSVSIWRHARKLKRVSPARIAHRIKASYAHESGATLACFISLNICETTKAVKGRAQTVLYGHYLRSNTQLGSNFTSFDHRREGC